MCNISTSICDIEVPHNMVACNDSLSPFASDSKKGNLYTFFPEKE